MRQTKDGERYILVVQDVFSRFLYTEALTNKTPQVVAKAFEDILSRAGTTPYSLTTDPGPEFEGPFKEMLEANGIASYQKRKEDINYHRYCHRQPEESIGPRHTKTGNERLEQ